MPDQVPRRLERAEAVLAARRRALTVVLEDTHDRHNISAVLRTCESFGVQDVHLVMECDEAPELNPEITLNAHRWLTIRHHYGTRNAISALRAQGYQLFVSHLDATALPISQLSRTARAAYVFGNERKGVSPQWLVAADALFMIPTSGFSGSLNLSVAVALAVYDRIGCDTNAMSCGDLSDVDKHTLRTQWYAALAHGSPEVAARNRDFLAQPPTAQTSFPVDRHRDHGAEKPPS